jgi:autotransporter-associated beta strand protein
MKPRLPILALGSLALVLATSASAQSTYTWDTTASGNTGSWATATHWTADAVPTANDTASFTTAASPATITLDGDQNIKSLVFSNASASWTLNAGSVAGSTLNFTDGDTTAGENTSFVTVTDTIVNINVALGKTIAGGTTNASDGIIFNGSGGTVNLAGNLNGPRTNPNYLHLGSNGTAGTTGMIYNINTANSLKNRLYAGFNNGAGNSPVNSHAGTTVNINASQSFAENIENAVAGGSNTANAGVMVIRNGANWDQQQNSLLVGWSSSTGQSARSHGRIEIGVTGDSTGSLVIGNSGGLTIGNRGGTGILNVNNGTVTINANSDTATTVLGGASANINLSGGGNGTIHLNAGGTLITARQFATQQAENGSSGIASGTGTFNFNGGLLQINRATGLVTTDLFEDNITVNVLDGGARIDTQAHSTTINEALTGVGNGGLTKTGAGTLTLAGNNTFTGNTVITTGTLALTGVGSISSSTNYNVNGTLDVSTITPGTFTVGAGKTLSGSGTISATGKTLSIGGTHAVGNNNVSQQDITGTVSYAPGSIFEWQLTSNVVTGRGSQFDAADVAGTLNVGSGAIFKIILGTAFDSSDAFWMGNRSWDVFTATTSNSSFDTFKLYNSGDLVNQASYGSFGSFSYGFASGTGTLTWTAVPEPTSAALAGLLITAGLLRRRRH